VKIEYDKGLCSRPTVVYTKKKCWSMSMQYFKLLWYRLLW